MKVTGRAGALRGKVESSEIFKIFSLPAALGEASGRFPEKRFESPILIPPGLFKPFGGVLQDKLKQLKKA
jgi:hypothetical protein